MTERQVDFSNAQLTMYESPRDPPDNGNNNSNMWAVLANTERWLSDTLASQEGQNNPFTRKEVSYVCENNSEAAMITAGIFRRLREAREQGETHGRVEEERLEEQGMFKKVLFLWILWAELNQLVVIGTRKFSLTSFAYAIES